MVVEDEIIHWWRDEKGELHRNALRMESEPAARINGFPRDGIVTVRLVNSAGQQAIRLSPDEAMRVSTQLLTVAKEMLNGKRALWAEQEEYVRQ
ncbi:MAG: hypothetical protein PHF51_02950 [Candidatus ainarchaeum sp.]|nr:hypothetical protein [Candidatus ainarchaeum sp.]